MNTSINLEYAPNSYFSNIDLETRIRSKITGQIRKESVVESSNTKFTPPYILKGKISKQQRSEIGKIHPHNMGGEYLTALEQNQVEICRIVMQSTTLDVTSIRATLVNTVYFFSVIDEYEIFKYELPIKSSEKPLKTSQVLEQIDNCLIIVAEASSEHNDQLKGLMDPALSLHLGAGCEPTELIDFISVESAFYPELGDYYRNKINNYLRSL